MGGNFSSLRSAEKPRRSPWGKALLSAYLALAACADSDTLGGGNYVRNPDCKDGKTNSKPVTFHGMRPGDVTDIVVFGHPKHDVSEKDDRTKIVEGDVSARVNALGGLVLEEVKREPQNASDVAIVPFDPNATPTPGPHPNPDPNLIKLAQVTTDGQVYMIEVEPRRSGQTTYSITITSGCTP